MAAVQHVLGVGPRWPDAAAAAAHPGRLVTFVGTAGAGKTRLAVEAAHAAGHPDGSCLVDLTVATPGRVLETVTSTLGQPFGSSSTDPLSDLRQFAATRSPGT